VPRVGVPLIIQLFFSQGFPILCQHRRPSSGSRFGLIASVAPGFPASRSSNGCFPVYVSVAWPQWAGLFDHLQDGFRQLGRQENHSRHRTRPGVAQSVHGL
jgi:hypothetical protein